MTWLVLLAALGAVVLGAAGWLAWRWLIAPAVDRYRNNDDHPLG